jgi:hypothetical protein
MPVVSGFVWLHGKGRKGKERFKEEKRDGDRT